MKKLTLILIGMALAAGILATAGLVYAATEDPPETQTTDESEVFPPGPFMGRRGGGMWGFWGREDGILHEYILPAIAGAFDLNDEQVAAFQKVRETIQGIRDELSSEEIQNRRVEAFNTAAGNALEDGAITQEQYDLMIAQGERGGRAFGPMGGGRRGGFHFEGIERRAGGGILQEYMDAAMAAALDVTVEELETMKAEGFNLVDYAEENDMTVEELHNLVKEIHTATIQAALDDGAITQEQYDLMLERLESDERLPLGPGFGGRGGPGW